MLTFLLTIGIYIAIAAIVSVVFRWPWRTALKSCAFNIGLYAACYLLFVVGRWVIYGSQ